MPIVPKTLVYLGEAIEVEADAVTWRWAKSDLFIVAASESGRSIFVFCRPKKRIRKAPQERKKAEKLYKNFNRRPAAGGQKIDVPEATKRVGRVLHIVYRSTKFGPSKSFIHVFERPPLVWVDKINRPKILALTGGKIIITRRGIEG